MGETIIDEMPGGLFLDLDSNEVPSLDAAVRAYAEYLIRATAMPGRWVNRPPRHDTWQETVASAF
jgi:hypothetical protein